MKIIGITGNSGSGKTTVSNIIEKEYNAKKIDADQIAKELSKNGTEYFKEIVEYFGAEILDSNRQIDRKKLANIIFNNNIKRARLNEITEKYVVLNINKKIEEYSKQNELIVIDVPLLFESDLHKKCDFVIGVISDEALKIERICKRDNIEKEIAQKRIEAQKSDEFLIGNCTNIITNDGDTDEISQQIDLIFNENIIYKNTGKIKYIQFKKLKEYPEIEHAFVIKPLNFRGTDEVRLLENYKKIAKVLDIDVEKIVKPHQTHTDNIYNVKDEIGIHIEKLNNVDGLLTSEKQRILSLTFADCMPIYLYDPVKKVIGNIHSGWKGTLGRIGQKAALQMQRDYECKPQDIVCVLGPAIRKCHFEVEQDVYELFKNEYEHMEEWQKIAEKVGDGKYHIDTALINKLILKEAGLKEQNIVDTGICTVCNSKIMHSYRVEKEQSRQKHQPNIFKIM